MRVSEIEGVPSALIDILHEQGIEELFPPQKEAVEAGILSGENLVASVPTASGKTLMAVLAMLAAIERGGKALYIVPLRALASEKHAEFSAYEAAGLEVGISTGNYESSDEWLASRDIIVATSEKVDSLIRNGASWIGELTCVVADEIHLVDDANRGPTLEVTLAKLQRICPGIHTVALSATVGNAAEIATWLDATLIDSEWRPIELRRGVQYGQAIHFEDGQTADIRVERGESQTAALTRDTLDDGGSTLVFVNSRRNAEAEARRLAGITSPTLTPDERDRLADLADSLLGDRDTETDSELAGVVERGAAFHHAGLLHRSRNLIEDAFRDRLIKVVCATPTLAAGVNTPSRRVVVRDWRRYDGGAGGMVPLSTLEVHQMFGRAGRPGLDPFGEALVLASSHSEFEELVDRYVRATPEPVRSKLAAEPALRTHVLSTIADGFASTREGLLEFLDRTLYAIQTTESGRLPAVADQVVAYLETNGFVERSGDALQATGIGHTVSRLYLDPMSAALIMAGLESSEEAPGELGLYHLVSRTPDMYALYLRSGDRERFTEVHYDRESELLGPAPSEFEEGAFEDWLSALKTATLLDGWASEVDEDVLTDRFGIGPGDIRAKVDTAEWLLGATERLATELDVAHVESIARARKRVEHGVKEELLDLVSIRNVGRKRARRLHDAGLRTRVDVREASPALVLKALRGRRATTETILENVGHPTPSLDDVEVGDATVEVPAGRRTSGTDVDEDQSSLGDY